VLQSGETSRKQPLFCKVSFLQPEKILLPTELTVFLAGLGQFSPLIAGELSLFWGTEITTVDGACRTHLARLLLGSPSNYATAVQLSPSLRQRATASAFCCAVNRRLFFVGLVIKGQSEGHGMTPIDLSTKSGELQWSE
jgi:hypothetical protein